MPSSSSSRRDGPSRGSSRRAGGSSAPSYRSSSSRDPHSSRYTGGERSSGRSGGQHKSRTAVPTQSQFPGDTSRRQWTRIKGLRQTAEQVFHTTPCTGAMLIIITLILCWFVGLVVGAVMFTNDSRSIGDVKDLGDMGDAIAMIGRDKKSQGSLVVLALFVGSMAFMWLYLGVVVLYNTIINKKGIYLWMKRLEADNEGDRQRVKDKKVEKGWRLIDENSGDVR